MPAIITHYTYCLETMKAPDRRYKEAVYLGAQGPDPFFFFGQLPWRQRHDRHDVTSFGVDLHHMDITVPYEELMKYAYLSPDAELLFAYIEGLLLHYTLDRNCHPYIFPKAGFSDDPAKKAAFSASHCALETVIDLLIGQKNGTFSLQPEKYMKIDKNQLKKIAAMWASVNGLTLKKEHFDENSFVNAHHDYSSILFLTNNPHNFMRWLMKHTLGVRSVPYAMNYPRKLPEKYASLDFLNERHAEWPNPVTGEKHCESFMDLWSNAQRDYEKAFLLLEKAKTGADIHDDFYDFVGDIDHDGCHPNDKKAYMDIIWPEAHEALV